MNQWPKEVKVYLHSDKDSMWETGEEIGLSEEALKKFRHTLTEVTVTLEVFESGEYRALEFKDL